MPIFHVSGADRATGSEVSRAVEAESEEEVRRRIGRSMLIERVERVKEPVLGYQTPVPAARPSSKGGEAKEVPGYIGLQFSSHLLMILGIIGLLGGAVMLFVAASARGEMREFQAAMGGAVMGSALTTFFAGCMGLAMRDIARNSFPR